MRPNLLLILFAFLSVFGCSKNDDSASQDSELPEIPEPVTHDLNGDAVDDFAIVYSKGIWDGAGASGFL